LFVEYLIERTLIDSLKYLLNFIENFFVQICRLFANVLNTFLRCAKLNNLKFNKNSMQMHSSVFYCSVFFLCFDHGQTMSMSTKKTKEREMKEICCIAHFFLFYQQNYQVGTTVAIIKKKKSSTSSTMKII